VSPDDCQMILEYVLEVLSSLGGRPSIRLFVDKAVPDFEFRKTGKSQLHWKDLAKSSLEGAIKVPQEPLNDVSRSDQTDRERRIAAELGSIENTKERLATWIARTGKSQAAFYRRLSEAKRQGLA